MDATTLVPATGPYLVEWWVFQSFLSFGFFIHILLVNVIIGGAAVALVNTYCGQDCTEPVGREVSKKLPTLVALTVNFGVAPLLFLQALYGHFFYISDILMGWFWLSVPFLIMLAYYMAYIYDFKFDRLGSLRPMVIGLGLLCLLAVAFFFVNNISMFVTPERWKLFFGNDGGTLLNWHEPTLIPRYLHFILASLAVGGLVTALWWSTGSRAAEPLADWHVERGMKWFFRLTLLQFVIGPWLMLAMEREVMWMYLGHNGIHTGFFLAGVVGGLMCLHAGFFRQPRRAAFYLVSTVAFMVGVREMMRISYLKGFYRAWDIPVSGEYSPMLMFAVVLVLGVGMIIYVLKLAANAGKEG